MKLQTLGRTGLQVSQLGLGGLFLSDVGGNDGTSAREVVSRAVDLGVNFVDTAPLYANSEEVLGEALNAAPTILLSTKIGGRPAPFDPRDAGMLRRSVETSLQLLRRDHIDVLFIHEPDRPGVYDWWTDHDNFHGPVHEVMEDLKAEGLIRFTGLAGTTAYQLAAVIATGRYDVALTAFNYSLLWTEAELAVLPEAERQGMGIIAASPLQQGALARRYDAMVSSGARWLSPPRRAQFLELYRLTDEIEIALPELALRFVISHPAVDMVLTGARSVSELEANAAAIERGPLPATVLERLREIQLMVPFRPCDEPMSLPFDRPYAGPGPG